MKGVFLLGLFLVGTVFGRDEAGEVTPVRCLLYTPEEILAVRQAVKKNPLSAQAAQYFLGEGDRWSRMDVKDLQLLVPAADSIFAAGFAGDPKTNEDWPRYGRNGICSVDKPFAVTSPQTGEVYGLKKAGQMYYDDGHGWKRSSDGKMFYFRGIWNTFILIALHEAVDNLSISYMLTGDEKYASRALWILDQFATLRSKRSDPDGMVDWPAPMPRGYGFMCYPGNLGNDRMLASALAFDLIGNSPAASEPSKSRPELTLFENIRQNYFSVFEKWYVENGSSFQNHAVSAQANSAAQALLFGDPEKVRNGIEACYGFLDNTADRDGEYYEVSGSYGELGREYGGSMLNLFGHYSPNRFADPKAYPRPENYPYDLRFGDDPAWFKTAVASLYRVTVLSRRPQYGDDSPQRFTLQKPPGLLTLDYLARQRVVYLKLLYHQTQNPEWKALCQQLYWRIPEKERAEQGHLINGIRHYGPSQWMEIPRPEEDELPWEFREDISTVVAQKRIGMLRSGKGDDQRAVFMRGGVYNSHGHHDQMAVKFYSHGMLLNGEYGYELWGTPDHRGWGTRSIAHDMAVVDENLPPSSEWGDTPPARINGYLPYPPAQMIEMSNPAQWPEARLTEYRRQTWMIDLPENGGYFLDVFRIEGGRIHDYIWRAPFADAADSVAFQLKDVVPRTQKEVWTLAALDGKKFRGETFNQPGKSWGERLEPGGTMRNLGLPNEKLPSSDWNPAPGNGYGFIWDVKTADTAKDWSATWLLPDEEHAMKMTMLNPDGQTVITGKAPSLKADRHFNAVIARRQKDKSPLRSRFVAVTQVAAGERWPLTDIRWLQGLGEKDVGISITRQDGGRDKIFMADPARLEMRTKDVFLKGRAAFVRMTPQGTISCVLLNEGTALDVAGISLRLPAAAWDGRVIQVSKDEISVDVPLPGQGQLQGQGVYFSSAPNARTPYSSNEFFTIEKIRKTAKGSILQFVAQSVVAARLKIAKVEGGVVQTYWPNEMAALPREDKGNRARVFEGHLLVSEKDPLKQATIQSYLAGKRLEVDRPEAIKAEDFYQLMATQPADRMHIPSLVLLKKLESGEWGLRANMDLEVKLPGSRWWALKNPSGAPVELKPSADGFLKIPVVLLARGEGILVPVSKNLNIVK